MKNLKKSNKKHYGLFTATAMIVGCVIGSGIFFKSDDILNYTGGNVLLGIMVFCIGAFGIIFGSLTLSELAIRTEKNGGVVGYFEEFISNGIAGGFGWFQTFIYFPSIVAVIAWVSGIYTCVLFGIDNTLEMQVLIGTGYIILFYGINMLSAKLGGDFQDLTTVIKIIPLLGIGIAGLFAGQGNYAVSEGIKEVSKSDVGMGWVAALVPMAYSFDGWVVSLSISNEVENPKKNMTLALIFGPLIILGVYILYFLGLTKLLGAEYIMATGDAAINKIGEILIGGKGSVLILTIVIISILGVVNGIVLGSSRMPQALASKGMIPFSGKIEKLDEKKGLSFLSGIVSFGITLIWMVIHYITQKAGIMGKGDVSEIAIVFSYLCYVVLFIKVMRMKSKNEITSKFKGIVCPTLGIVGAVIIFIGGVVLNPIYGSVFMVICLVVCIMGYFYFKKNNR